VSALMAVISLVVAVARGGIIGRDGGLPWHISSDLKRFKQLTMGKPVIMGRKTWESLPKRPLPGRQNIVITRDKTYRAEGAHCVASLAQALTAAGEVDEICVIGGGSIYREALPLAGRIYFTDVDLDVEGDTHFPVLTPNEWQETAREVHPRGEKDSAGFVLRVLERV
jgi:dihydrofolate reductase